MVLLSQGRVVGTGQPQQIFEQHMSAAFAGRGTSLADRTDRDAKGEHMVRAITFLDEKLQPVQSVRSGQHLVLCGTHSWQLERTS